MLVTYGDDGMADVQLEERKFIRPPAILSGTETKCLRAGHQFSYPMIYLNFVVHILDRWFTDLVTSQGQRDYKIVMRIHSIAEFLCPPAAVSDGKLVCCAGAFCRNNEMDRTLPFPVRLYLPSSQSASEVHLFFPSGS